jgi:hypothetical protein
VPTAPFSAVDLNVLKNNLKPKAGLLGKKQTSGRAPSKTGLIMIIAFFAVVGDVEPLGLGFF